MSKYTKKIFSFLFVLGFMISLSAPLIFADNGNKRVICSMVGKVIEVRITAEKDSRFASDLKYCCVAPYGYINTDNAGLDKLFRGSGLPYISTEAADVEFFSRFVEDFRNQKRFCVKFSGEIENMGSDAEGVEILNYLADNVCGKKVRIKRGLRKRI